MRAPLIKALAKHGVWAAACLAVGFSGCEHKTLDSAEYGEIMPKAPRLKEAAKPYPLPQLKDPAAADSPKK